MVKLAGIMVFLCKIVLCVPKTCCVMSHMLTDIDGGLQFPRKYNTAFGEADALKLVLPHCAV
jgi:hypothetical protein